MADFLESLAVLILLVLVWCICTAFAIGFVVLVLRLFGVGV